MASTPFYIFIFLLLIHRVHGLWASNSYRMGDILSFQCFDGVEYKDIICENGNLTITYGLDGFMTCRWNPMKWGFLNPREYLLEDKPLHCRIQNSKNTEVYTSFYVQFLSQQDNSHIYIYSHYFMSVHAERGQILSIGFYPAQKSLHLVRSDGDLYLQINIKWFKGITYNPFLDREIEQLENQWKTWEITVKFVIFLIIFLGCLFVGYYYYKRAHSKRDNFFSKWD